MDEKELNDIRKMVANHSRDASVPIDYEALISKGILKQVGKSYYVESINSLPKDIKSRVKSMSKGRHGIKVTFSKETQSMKKLSKKFEQFRD